MKKTLALFTVVAVGIGTWWIQQQPDEPARAGDVPAATASLDQLTIAPETTMAGYDRDERFGDWQQRPGLVEHEHCDTREIVLYRQGNGVSRDSACEVTSGTWQSVYTGEPVALADIEVDHQVPLAAAWRSGAADWTQQRREAFANDLARPQLVAVDGSSNSSKSDSGPAEWQPTVDRCGYARDWITVKAHYDLTVDRAEHDALAGMLATCR